MTAPALGMCGHISTHIHSGQGGFCILIETTHRLHLRGLHPFKQTPTRARLLPGHFVSRHHPRSQGQACCRYRSRRQEGHACPPAPSALQALSRPVPAAAPSCSLGRPSAKSKGSASPSRVCSCSGGCLWLHSFSALGKCARTQAHHCRWWSGQHGPTEASGLNAHEHRSDSGATPVAPVSKAGRECMHTGMVLSGPSTSGTGVPTGPTEAQLLQAGGATCTPCQGPINGFS